MPQVNKAANLTQVSLFFPPFKVCYTKFHKFLGLAIPVLSTSFLLFLFLLDKKWRGFVVGINTVLLSCHKYYKIE